MGSSVPYGAQSLTRHPANEERDDGAGGELEGLYFQSPSLVCGETEARRWEGDICKRPQRDGVPSGSRRRVGGVWTHQGPLSSLGSHGLWGGGIPCLPPLGAEMGSHRLRQELPDEETPPPQWGLCCRRVGSPQPQGGSQTSPPSTTTPPPAHPTALCRRWGPLRLSSVPPSVERASVSPMG